MEGHFDFSRVRPSLGLTDACRRVRRNTLRAICEAGSGHPGSSLSAVEILVSLYLSGGSTVGAIASSTRDRFVLSKGHAAPALYAVLAEIAILDPECLRSLRKLGSPLQGHPDRRMLPFLDASTGSLGQGLSIGCGLALAQRLDGHQGSRTYVLLGDGELNEGQVWEAIMLASHLHLGNLVVIVDWNGFQNDGPTARILNLADVESKFRVFGWTATSVDGHDVNALSEELARSRAPDAPPHALLAKTVKGRGVSFMEGNEAWHAKAPTQDELDTALRELAER